MAALAPELRLEVLGRKGFIPSDPFRYREVDVRAMPAPKHASIEALVSTLISVLRAARTARVIHIHAIGPALLVPLARALGLRVIMTHHGTDYDRGKWGSFAKAMLRLGERLGVAGAHEVIAVAPTLAEQLKRRFPKRREAIHCIPNGAPHLPDDEDTDEVLRRFGLTPKGYVLAVGRLVPEKGFDTLIRAFRRSRTARLLVIVGSDIHDSRYSAALRAEADERVRFLGGQPRTVLRRLYEQADLFVLPSLHEGLPISALEAASCGTPMLLSDIMPNRDLGLESRNYFRAGDEAGLAACLASKGKAFGCDAAALRQTFDWDRIAEQTLSIYRRLSA
jgi:glycosyltransferase involved in cell wall biosynthesis